MSLDISTYIFVKSVRKVPAAVHLDEEQMQWLEKAAQDMKGYEGKIVTVSILDAALDVLGEHDARKLETLESCLKKQLLSLRNIKPSKVQQDTVRQHAQEVRAGNCSWRPVVGIDDVYLEETGGQLIVGICTPTEIDGCGVYTTRPVLRIEYRQP